jgi:hypothetical protein
MILVVNLYEYDNIHIDLFHIKNCASNLIVFEENV